MIGKSQIGRGLGFYQKPGSWFDLGVTDLELRKSLRSRHKQIDRSPPVVHLDWKFERGQINPHNVGWAEQEPCLVGSGERLQPHSGNDDLLPVPKASHLGLHFRYHIGIVAAADAQDVDLIPANCVAGKGLDNRQHHRVVGPDPTVDQSIAAMIERAEIGRRGRCGETDIDHKLLAIGLIVGMVRRLNTNTSL
jgi:hypothetical protein